MKCIGFALFLAGIFPIFTSTQAQTIDTIRVNDHRLQLGRLATGTHRYLVYNETAAGERTNMWIWERTVTTGFRPGAPIKAMMKPYSFIITQHWYGSDAQHGVRKVTSVVRHEDFAPLYHFSELTANGKTQTEAFDFRADSVVTPDTVTTTAPRTAQALPEPTYNWELDLELFPLLPLKDGKTMAINFYHPGAPLAPAYYNYTVKGSDNLLLYNGRKASCWVLTIDYGQGNYAIWWIDKKKHLVWRMKEYFNGQYRFKVLMTS